MSDPHVHEWETTHFVHERDEVPVTFNSMTDTIGYRRFDYHAEVEQTCTGCGEKRDGEDEECECEGHSHFIEP